MAEGVVHAAIYISQGRKRRFEAAACEFASGGKRSVPESACVWDEKLRGVTCEGCLDFFMALEIDDLARDMERRRPFVSASQLDGIMFTLEEAADVLGITEVQLRRMCALGDLRLLEFGSGPDLIERVDGQELVGVAPRSQRAFVIRRLDALFKARQVDSEED